MAQDTQQVLDLDALVLERPRIVTPRAIFPLRDVTTEDMIAWMGRLEAVRRGPPATVPIGLADQVASLAEDPPGLRAALDKAPILAVIDCVAWAQDLSAVEHALPDAETVGTIIFGGVAHPVRALSLAGYAASLTATEGAEERGLDDALAASLRTLAVMVDISEEQLHQMSHVQRRSLERFVQAQLTALKERTEALPNALRGPTAP